MPSPTSTWPPLSVRSSPPFSPFNLSYPRIAVVSLPGWRRDELKGCLTSGVLLFANSLAIRRPRIIDNGTGLSGCATNAVHPSMYELCHEESDIPTGEDLHRDVFINKFLHIRTTTFSTLRGVTVSLQTL